MDDTGRELRMSFGVCSFSSGSSGNCYLVRTGKTALLIDAGISRRRILEGLEKTQTARDMVQALLITHEHTDHIKGLETLLKREAGIFAYANQKTWEQIEKPISAARKKIFITGETFVIGDISVRSFPVSHDAAEPVGFSLTHDGRQISVVTDTGWVGEDVLSEIQNADILILEANHDEDVLKFGRYPWSVKQRILSDTGHLSNSAAGNVIVNLLTSKRKRRCVLLAHMSEENNFPEMAMRTIRNMLEEKKFSLKKDVHLQMIFRDEISLLYEL
jgi:phosphoribosyl 1,2-cyclic phosphodiesterase